jgi:methyl-accepting chemotaxis protein
MHTLTFRQKLWMPLIISILGLLIVGIFNAYQAREVRLGERQSDLIHANEIALSIIKQYASYADSGAMSVAEAQKQSLERIKALRFGQDGYISVSDFDARSVMHPIKPELSGKDLRDFKDQAGNPVYVMISDMARNSGSGFINYVWPHAAGGDPVPKTSHVLAYKPWQWALTTGAYTDDINSEVLKSLIFPSLVLAAIVAVLSLFIAYAARSIQKQLGGDPGYASAVAAKIATGDLSAEIDTVPGDTNSLIANMKAMRDSLVKTIHGITSSADNVAVAAKEIAGGNLDLSQRTEEQAASLGETASSMAQITTMVKRTADNAKRATELAGDAANVTNRGGATVSEVVETMRDISSQSNKMVEIISVIEGIAFQTNILALNAAVEAARAGEQGRGFAVVAGEVRTLAQRSATAAKEIRDLIQTSVGKIDTGSTLVESAGATMKEAQAALSRVSGIIHEIETAAQQQSQGIAQITVAVAQMDEVTQQNAALVEEASAAAQSLEEQAAHLRSEMATFKLREPARGHVEPARERPPIAVKSARDVIDRARKVPARAAKPAVARERPAPKKTLAATASSADDWETF